ncbi:uncharacterized protein LOC129104627 [Anoplopoma fimbria]|uniref:uncharacterized protein LOC129104627 n=1 Tax=Anoplopoma fimbria TaxID=229290 RepID=UPI0023ED6FA8|nr:uncharacterized protein LOC129104627 [Anoplopoma fimbria]XP_054471391.1 uncharacterized protein LOC129104627 [Anoplopoma fimbria]XP_054471400.1 uncharacterized protein LOC129104627 [Anoplopoma fimbria]
MSADLYCASDSGGNNANLQGTTLGGSKPLHRFIKGQPKIIGIIALVLGSSFFILSIAITQEARVQFISTAVPPGFMLGTLFIICGILYILTEYNPTKKTVTMSLALSIVTILGACWTLMHILTPIAHHHSYDHFELEDNFTYSLNRHYEAMVISVELIFLVHSVVGAIFFIVMSCLAVAALRSTKSQAIIMMTTMPAETPVE